MVDLVVSRMSCAMRLKEKEKGSNYQVRKSKNQGNTQKDSKTFNTTPMREKIKVRDKTLLILCIQENCVSLAFPHALSL